MARIPEDGKRASSLPGWGNDKGGNGENSMNQPESGQGGASAYAAFSAVSDAISARNKAIFARNKAQGDKNMLAFDAQVHANQAAIAGYQAEIAQQTGAQREQSARLQTAAQTGNARAHMAASGIDLGQGSATDVLASTAYMGEREAMMIRDDTNRQMWNYRNQQAMDLAQQKVKLAQMNAINPDMEAFGSMLGSAAAYFRK